MGSLGRLGAASGGVAASCWPVSKDGSGRWFDARHDRADEVATGGGEQDLAIGSEEAPAAAVADEIAGDDVVIDRDDDFAAVNEIGMGDGEDGAWLVLARESTFLWDADPDDGTEAVGPMLGADHGVVATAGWAGAVALDVEKLGRGEKHDWLAVEENRGVEEEADGDIGGLGDCREALGVWLGAPAFVVSNGSAGAMN